MATRKQTPHNPKYIVILVVLAVALFVGAMFAIIAATKDKNNSVPRIGEQITIEGEFVCLPHKDTGGPQTLECASGIKTDSGEYYGLQFDMTEKLPPSSGRLRVTGTLEDQQGSYDSEGLVRVESYEEL